MWQDISKRGGVSQGGGPPGYEVQQQKNMKHGPRLEASPEQLGSSEEEFVMDSSNCLLVI